MYELKGFYEIPSYINNLEDQTAMFGEISDDSLTYAKDKTVLTGSSTPNVALISFHSVRDENVVAVEGAYSDQIMKLGQYLYDQAQLGVINSNPATLRQLVMAEFSTTIETFSCGVIRNNGKVWLPEYVEVKLLNTSETNRCVIWLADESFRAQYDGYIIEIVQPLIPVDDFFKDPLIVKQMLAEYSIVDKLEEAQATRAQYPYTYLKAMDFDYVNPSNTTQNYKATWLVIVYGEAGNNADLIKDAIVKDILSKSSRPREDWEVILPDLFLTTEFIFTPMWTRFSIPNAQFQGGIHSPIFDPATDLSILRKTVKGPGYSDTFVNNNYQVSVNQYKSLSFAVVGNPQNRAGMIKFSQQFPQYVVAETGTGDSNRIDPDTLEWMMLFSRLIKAAETMTQYTSVPRGVSRMTRDGVVYAAAFFKNVNYMVTSSYSVVEAA